MKSSPNSFKMFLLFGVALVSASCDLPLLGKKEVAKATVTGTGLVYAPSTSCTSTVVDTGQKGSVAAVARGLYSDTKIIPGTNWPATAYVDQTAVSMKFTFWDGTKYVTEVISGDGSGVFVRFAFLSTGVPVVIWTLGANLKAAIRTNPLDTSGTWNVAVIDTGVAPRAPEISVNPRDQVAVTFITDTAVTGRAKFLYCDATCSSPSNFQTMGVSANPRIENTNVVAAQVSTGSGWCKVSSSVYYPVASYSVTGVTKYAICQNTLPNCLNGANWTTQSVVATGNIASKVYLDSSITGDVPKVVSLGAGGVVPFRMGATLCTAVPGAFTAGAAIGTATTGNQWMSIMKDSASKFHLVANESTTSVRYYNSTTTDIIGAWNPQGTIDTVTLAAANGGGAAISTTDNGIYSSYGLNAVPFDLRFGRVNNYTVSSNTATFTRLAPDLTGNIQLQAASSALKNIAVASTAASRVVTAYVDYSVGSVAAAKLKFAYRTAAAASSSWQITVIPGTINPQFPGLVVDNNNRPWVSYYDASLNVFRVSTNSLADGTGTWTTYDFPSTPSGAPVALPAANHTAMGLYYDQVTGEIDPVMVVIDTNTVSKGVKAARFSASSRNFYTPVVVDGLTAGALGASNLSVHYDSSGNIVLAYQDLSANRVKYSRTDNTTSYSAPLAISSVGQGQGVSIRLNPITGSPSISYFDQANNTVFLNRCSGSPSACATGGWTPTQIETAAGVSGLTLATGQLLSTALNYTSGGYVSLFYPRGQANDGNLVQSVGNSSMSSSIAAMGSNASVSGAPALNFAVAGWNVEASVNSTGSFTALYVGPGNWLYATSCDD